jgi:poly-beta-1,6-N-acetyl-D-glucosamine synthase
VAAYATVTPARNERENLTRLAGAMLGQDLRPRWWVIVDDGSEDGTRELAGELAATHDWIVCVTPEPASANAIAQGRREGRDLLAFRAGAAALPGPVEVIVKVDADTSFAADYFAELIGRFDEDATLGIASGSCWELEGEEWVRRKVMPSHPRGATRAYRWPCFEASLALEPKMGWDGLDEVRAHLMGYRTVCFTDIGFRHHRPMGGRERGRLRAASVLGRASWYMGYRPSYVLARTAYHTLRDPASIAMVWGYTSAALRRSPRCPEHELVERLRRDQRLRTALARGTPP